MLETSRSPKKVFPSHSPSLSSFSMPSGFGKRMPSSSPSIGLSATGSMRGNSSSISLMRPIMGLSSSSFDLGMSGLILEPSSPTSSFLRTSSSDSSDAVHFMRPTPPFEKNSDDLSKELGSSSSLNIELLEESPVAPLIENFLEPWLTQLRAGGGGGTSPTPSKSSFLSDSKRPVAITIDDEFPIDSVVVSLLEHAQRRDREVKSLMEAMNSSTIIVPYLNLDLPVDIIMQYNELDPDDPQLLSLQLDPVIATEIRELGVFIDRYDTEKGVICLLLWSTVDHALVCLPSLGLQPYPLCWKCNSAFGLSPCRKCGIARYCSEHCMAQQSTLHQKACSDMEGFVRRHRILTLEPATLSPTPQETNKNNNNNGN